MENLVMVVHVLAAAAVIGLVLLQHGKGADMGAAFGSGASGSLFGVSGSSNFLSRATAICVMVFFTTSLALAYIASHRTEGGSVIKSAVQAMPTKTEESKPVDAKPAEVAPAEASPGSGGTAKDIPN